MAKKRRKEEKKEVFTRPEFDEVEFMQKEISNTKVAMLTIIFSLPIAVLSAALTMSGLPAAGFLIGVGAIFLLKYIYGFFNVEVEEFKAKDWLGNAAMFFFTWLAVWVLILNMPFTDLTSPTIGKVDVLGCPAESPMRLESDEANSCTVGNISRNFSIQLKVTDNSGVESVTLEVTSPTSASYPMAEGSDDKYSYQLMLSGGDSLIFEIVAEDINGQKSTSPSYTFIAEQ